MPISMSGDNIRVNIPEYMLYVYENDNLQWSCKVVVGNDSNNTTVFSDYMEQIVFSPYWHVPRSILFKETIPAIKENPGYLAAHNMEVTDEMGNVIDPSQADWDAGEENFHYLIRQRPGSDNSLGRVKFLLPNSHSIYLHDTPAKSLFGENERAFSHGCIRVSEPLKLAQYLLRLDARWTADSIKSAMYGEKEVMVRLPQKVPVYITYFTAWVDVNGDLNFREDIYEHDEKMKKVLPL
jgi:murein L,D-transpeptidase YcbB/YkuD